MGLSKKDIEMLEGVTNPSLFHLVYPNKRLRHSNHLLSGWKMYEKQEKMCLWKNGKIVVALVNPKPNKALRDAARRYRQRAN